MSGQQKFHPGDKNRTQQGVSGPGRLKLPQISLKRRGSGSRSTVPYKTALSASSLLPSLVFSKSGLPLQAEPVPHHYRFVLSFYLLFPFVIGWVHGLLLSILAFSFPALPVL